MDNLFDLHIYTNNSPCGNDKVSFLCETAVAKGLRAVAFTDICDCDTLNSYENTRRLRHACFDVTKAKLSYFDSLMVLLGIEFAVEEACPIRTEEILLKQEYDIVLARVSHFKQTDGFGIRHDDTEKAFDAFARRYTQALLSLIDTTDFDVLSQPLAPLQNLRFDFSVFRSCFEAVLTRLAQKNKALEINTADLSGSEAVRNLYRDIIADFKRLGGKYITLGSKSCYYEEVGRGIDIAVATAKRVGFEQITLYEKRTPYLFNI